MVRAGIDAPIGRRFMVGVAVGGWCMVTINAIAGDFPAQR